MSRGRRRGPTIVGQSDYGLILYCPDHPEYRYLKTSSNRTVPCPTCGKRLARLHPKGQNA